MRIFHLCTGPSFQRQLLDVECAYLVSGRVAHLELQILYIHAGRDLTVYLDCALEHSGGGQRDITSQAMPLWLGDEAESRRNHHSNESAEKRDIKQNEECDPSPALLGSKM